MSPYSISSNQLAEDPADIDWFNKLTTKMGEVRVFYFYSFGLPISKKGIHPKICSEIHPFKSNKNKR